MLKQFDEYQITELDTSDPESFFKMIESNRKNLEDFFAGTLASTLSLQDTIAYCFLMEARRKSRAYFPFIITNLKSGQYVGLVDVKNIDWSIPKAELGYFIDYQFEGRGITSKAVNIVIEYLTQKFKFKKLFCRISIENKGSIAVVLKNKFELEGTIRRDYKTTNKGIVDLNYYGRLFDF